MDNNITKEKLEKYFELTEKALKEIKIKDKKAEKLIDMSKRYFSDAEHFREKGKIIEAFAAVNYAHAFLDAAALLGYLENKDNKLFMVD